MNQPSTNAKTPLGEPMSQESTSERTRDPLEWHLKYFLNLYVIGILVRGQEADNDRSIGGRVMGEYWKLNQPLKTQFLNQWFGFREVHKQEYFQKWKLGSRDEEEFQAYARDFATMVRTNGGYRPV